MTITKAGRRNVYEVGRNGHLRHPLFSDLEIGPLLDVLNAKGRRRRTGASPDFT